MTGDVHVVLVRVVGQEVDLGRASFIGKVVPGPVAWNHAVVCAGIEHAVRMDRETADAWCAEARSHLRVGYEIRRVPIAAA